jgi:hypothetical protein
VSLFALAIARPVVLRCALLIPSHGAMVIRLHSTTQHSTAQHTTAHHSTWRHYRACQTPHVTQNATACSSSSSSSSRIKSRVHTAKARQAGVVVAGQWYWTDGCNSSGPPIESGPTSVVSVSVPAGSSRRLLVASGAATTDRVPASFRPVSSTTQALQAAARSSNEYNNNRHSRERNCAWVCTRRSLTA